MRQLVLVRLHMQNFTTLSRSACHLPCRYDTTPFVQYYYERDWAGNPGAKLILQSADASPCKCRATQSAWCFLMLCAHAATAGASRRCLRRLCDTTEVPPCNVSTVSPPAMTGGIREQSWMASLAELEAALAESAAGWKLVVGHHPVRSNGVEHGDTPELQRKPPSHVVDVMLS